ncbi:MAG: tetratricopeptide repeat protein [Bacteroidales bacterium]|jgi:Flp pilus assembly protein TadD/predicted small secreted protein|nr:tetratricopeptide repeat protein [Bacteroidales bacterium]
MKKVFFLIAIVSAMLSSCKNISNATVEDIQKACEKEDWNTAKEMCTAYMKKDKSNPVVLKYLGDAYLGLKDSSFAQYSYDQAIALDSMYVDAIVCSADVLMNGGDASLAISHLRTHMEYIPDNAKLHNALGCAFRIAENSNEAQANFERSVLLDQHYVVARRNLAVMQIENRELDDAILNLETVLDENPNQADVYNYLALAYAYKSNPEEAEKLFLKSISIDEKYLPAIENLAFHYEHNGNLNKAKKYYEKAAKLGSENAKKMLKNSKFDR